MLIRALAMILLLLCSAASYADENREVQTYWSRFRQAVLDEDSEKLARMTKFPLWVRGPVDSSPAIYYGRKDFDHILKKLLNQPVVVSNSDRVEVKTMLQVITEKKRLTQRDFQTRNIVRVELFRFDKINGTWLFTRGYIEE